MSRIARAQEIAKQVLGNNRNVRNQLILGRNMPPRMQGISQSVLGQPGGLTSAARAVGRSNAAGMGAGALLAGGGVMMLSQTDPNDLGRQLAQIDQPFYELIGKVQESASDLAEIPQVYFMQVKQAYDDERQKQQELQNIKEFGDPMGAPVEIPPSIEDQAIKPVSVFMAGGGSANVGDILGESGRTISGIDRAIAAGMGSPMMSDNEPRMQDRNQAFSIEADIQNLMKSYNMLVEAQEFDRAQQVANMIDQLQQQKIGVQGNLADIAINFDSQIGSPEFTRSPMGTTMSNQDREEITRILDSISI
jgi:hypothetical protein